MASLVCDCVALAAVRFRHLHQHFINQLTQSKSVVAGYRLCSKCMAAKCKNIWTAQKIKYV